MHNPRSIIRDITPKQSRQEALPAMLTPDDLIEIGTILKPHGVKGELSVTLHDADVDLAGLRCVFVEREGLPVPFFITGVRRKSTLGRLVHIDGIDSEEAARRFTGAPLSGLRTEVEAMLAEAREADGEDGDDDGDGVYANDLIGLTAVADGHPLGEVTAIDDSTANLLLVIKRAGADDGPPLLVPLAGEFIAGIDPDGKVLELTLPDGLLDL